MLQASEGGSFSVGNRKFKIRQSVTPRPLLTPPSSASGEGVPVAMPTDLRTERIARASRPSRLSRISPLRLTTLSPATDKMVVSKSALVGFCLTAFAAGVVITLAVDRAHTRAAESPREPDPVVLKTTPVETAPAAPTAAARQAVAPAPAPAATSAAAAEALVVQLPPPPEPEQVKPTKPAAPIAAPSSAARKVSAAAPGLPPAAPARKVGAAAPARPAAPRKPTRAAESNPTEAAPDEDPVLPATTKKKWSDPFEQ